MFNNPFWGDVQFALAEPIFGVELRVIALSLLILVAAILFKTLLADWLFAFLHYIAARRERAWNKDLLNAIQPAVTSFILVLGVYVALKVLPLPDGWNAIVKVCFKIITTLIVFGGVIRATNVGAEHITEYGQRRGLALATFVPLFRQIVIVLLVLLGVVVIVDNLGYSVTSLITALGIGGAAIALASQNTISNLYSSLAIALDKPFKVGDTVKIGAVEGTVAAIGLRSTLIQTVRKTSISIPNNTIANEAIENYTRSSRRRILATIAITYGTTQVQIEQILNDIRTLMNSMSELSPEPQQVYLTNFAESSIDLELMCFTSSNDVNLFYQTRQKLLLGVMEIIERHGSSFAFPTRTVHLAKE
jgi:MscS family membrane protein